MNFWVMQQTGKKRMSLWDRFNEFTAEAVDCRPGARAHRGPLRRILCYLWRLVDGYNTHQCSLMACACAFCALLSVVPLLAVAIAGLGFFLGGNEAALKSVIAAIQNYVPIPADSIRDILHPVIYDRSVIGAVGSIGLIYTAHQTFLAIQPALNLVWNVRETRHWLHLRLIAIVATFVTLTLLAADLGFSAFFAFLEAQSIPILPNRLEGHLVRWGLSAVPVGLTTLMFALLYRYLPDRRASWRAVILGAVVAAILWQVMKFGFGQFLLHVHSYNRLYGSLSGLVILVVWTYYSMAVMLLGAEIAADYESMQLGTRAAEERAHSGADLGAATGHDGHHVRCDATQPDAQHRR